MISKNSMCDKEVRLDKPHYARLSARLTPNVADKIFPSKTSFVSMPKPPTVHALVCTFNPFNSIDFHNVHRASTAATNLKFNIDLYDWVRQ